MLMPNLVFADETSLILGSGKAKKVFRIYSNLTAGKQSFNWSIPCESAILHEISQEECEERN